MPFVEAAEITLGAWGATGVSSPPPPFESPLIVEVEDERPKEPVKGAKCVSLSSVRERKLAIATEVIPASHAP